MKLVPALTGKSAEEKDKELYSDNSDKDYEYTEEEYEELGEAFQN